jgi:tetratricopeptide (TPR) repeat protein
MKEMQPLVLSITKAEAALRRQAWLAEGRLDAFGFALDCDGDVSLIRAEIQEWDEYLSQHTEGSMSPGASPRIYRESYLAALKEALDIISSLDYDQAIHREPDDPQAYVDRAFARYKVGNLSAAIDDYSEAIRLDPSHARTYYYRGIAYYAAGDFVAAIRDHSEAIHLGFPNLYEVYYSRGLAYYQAGDIVAAIHDFTESIHGWNRFQLPYIARGNAYYRAGDLFAAIDDFTEAIQRHSAVPEAYYNRGRVLAEQGKFFDAIADYERYLKLAPSASDRAEIEAEIERPRH